MGPMTRVTVTLPADLLEALDRKIGHETHSRSELFRRLLGRALQEEEERNQVERWARGYRERPQSEEELGWVDRVAAERLGEERWQ